MPGYQIYYNNREKLARRKSGGITLLVRDNLVSYIKVDTYKKSKFILWFTLSHEVLLSKKVMHCGILYIPPFYLWVILTRAQEKKMISVLLMSVSVIIMA